MTEKVRNCVISIYARLRNFKNHLTNISICFDKVFINFFSKINIYYKKYGVIIYDFSWKVWVPLLKMSYQKLYYSLTWINVNLLENKNLNH